MRALRVVLASLAGLVVMLAALVFGIVLGAGVLLWKLLGGRRGPSLHVGGHGAARRSVPRPGMSRQRPAQAEVIDVEVREVATR